MSLNDFTLTTFSMQSFRASNQLDLYHVNCMELTVLTLACNRYVDTVSVKR
jgi:hypothetical protein